MNTGGFERATVLRTEPEATIRLWRTERPESPVFLDQRGHRALLARLVGAVGALLAAGALLMIVLAATDFSSVSGVPMAGAPVILARVHPLAPPAPDVDVRMRRRADPEPHAPPRHVRREAAVSTLGEARRVLRAVAAQRPLRRA